MIHFVAAVITKCVLAVEDEENPLYVLIGPQAYGALDASGHLNLNYNKF